MAGASSTGAPRSWYGSAALLAAALAGAALLGSCTADCGDAVAPRADGHDPWRPPARAPARLGALPAVQPRWHVTLPGEPGPAWIDHSAGPVLAPAGDGSRLVLLASSAAGFVALEADSGAVRWHHPEERAPELPIAAPHGEIWLPGRCAHEAGPAHASSLGCVVITDRTGRIMRRVWIRAAAAETRAEAVLRGRRGRVLGRTRDGLLWAHGPDVLAVDVRRARIARVYRASEGITADVCGWLGLPGLPGVPDAAAPGQSPETRPEMLIVATCDGLMGFAGSDADGVRAPDWHRRVSRSVGVAGPVRAGRFLAWVRDHELQAGPGPESSWAASDPYAHAPGSLVSLGRERLLAVHMGDGIRPVVVDVATGLVVRKGEVAPGIQVLAAVPLPAFPRSDEQPGAPNTPALALAVRLDSTLRRDAVIVWDADLRAVWAWPLPMPSRSRIEPVGLAAVEGDVVVFYDGRHAARLPLTSMDL